MVSDSLCKGILKYWRFIKHEIHLALTKLKNSGGKGKKKKGKGDGPHEDEKDDKKFSTGNKYNVITCNSHPCCCKRIPITLETDFESNDITYI